jgi:hypothetical protein
MPLSCYAEFMPNKQASHSGHESWYANHINNAIRLIGLVVLSLAAVAVYRYLFADIITGRSHFLAYIALWLFSAYVILPRVYRAISRLYLPNYFFGRTQTGDGLLGDPINLAFNAKREQLILAMTAAGWSQATPLNYKSSLKMIYSAVRGTNYSDAPVSPLFVFGKKQNFAFEKDLDGNPRKRHHIRFWETPEKWWLPGGYKTDWLAAATFDKNVGLSLFTGQVTHKIDANVDQERDFVIDTLRHAKVVEEVTVVKHFTSSYHTRNGGGDMIHTDGALPFVTIVPKSDGVLSKSTA